MEYLLEKDMVGKEMAKVKGNLIEFGRTFVARLHDWERWWEQLSPFGQLEDTISFLAEC